MAKTTKKPAKKKLEFTIQDKPEFKHFITTLKKFFPSPETTKFTNASVKSLYETCLKIKRNTVDVNVDTLSSLIQAGASYIETTDSTHIELNFEDLEVDNIGENCGTNIFFTGISKLAHTSYAGTLLLLCYLANETGVQGLIAVSDRTASDNFSAVKAFAEVATEAGFVRKVDTNLTVFMNSNTGNELYFFTVCIGQGSENAAEAEIDEDEDLIGDEIDPGN